jgi:hypothetical protein
LQRTMGMFLDEAARAMVTAYIHRARQIYGPNPTAQAKSWQCGHLRVLMRSGRCQRARCVDDDSLKGLSRGKPCRREGNHG